MSVDNFKKKESSRVVVTDAAAANALGNNLESLWQGLMSGKTAIRPITRFPVDQDHYLAKKISPILFKNVSQVIGLFEE